MNSKKKHRGRTTPDVYNIEGVKAENLTSLQSYGLLKQACTEFHIPFNAEEFKATPREYRATFLNMIKAVAMKYEKSRPSK